MQSESLAFLTKTVMLNRPKIHCKYYNSQNTVRPQKCGDTQVAGKTHHDF